MTSPAKNGQFDFKIGQFMPISPPQTQKVAQCIRILSPQATGFGVDKVGL
jgi:hypothetical protein